VSRSTTTRVSWERNREGSRTARSVRTTTRGSGYRRRPRTIEDYSPNDRPHVLKISGAHRFDFGATAGAFSSLSSGPPLNEFQIVETPFGLPVFRVERGTAGRTPAIWDLNLRFSCALPAMVGGRVILDLLHLGNPQGIVDRDQIRFRHSVCGDGEGGTSPCGPFASHLEIIAGAVSPNPGFGEATAFQPPFTVRLGFEVSLGGR